MPPAFIAQGGSISETGKIAGENWHAFIGLAIYKDQEVENMRKAAIELTFRILARHPEVKNEENHS